MSVRKVIEVIIGGRSELGGVVDQANADLGRLGKGVPGATGGAGAGGIAGAGGGQELLKTTTASLRTLQQMVKVIAAVELGFRLAESAAHAMDGFAAHAAGNMEKAADSLKKLEAGISSIPVAGPAYKAGQFIRSMVDEQGATEARWAERQARESEEEVKRLADNARLEEQRRKFRESIVGPANAVIDRSRRELREVGKTAEQKEVGRLNDEYWAEYGKLRELYDRAENRREFEARDRVKKALELLTKSFEQKVADTMAKRAEEIKDEVDRIIDDVEKAGRDQRRELFRDSLAKAMDLRSVSDELDLYFPEDGEAATPDTPSRPTRQPRLGPLGATMLSSSYRGVGELFTAGLDPQAALVKSGDATARNTAATVEALNALVNALRHGASGPIPFNLSLR
jgi:hypothetical protein